MSPLYSHPPEHPPLDLRRRLLAGLVGLALLAPDAAWAETFTINSEADLRTALTNAQSGDTISFNANITLTAGDLPAVQKNVTILGNNFTLSGNNQFRGLFVAAFQPGTGTLIPVAVSIQDLTVANALARGGEGGPSGSQPGGGGAGLGGALFVASGAEVTVSNLSLVNNSATGGGGGSNAAPYSGEGGGGGMGGNGGVQLGGGGGLGSAANGGGEAGLGGPGIALGAAPGASVGNIVGECVTPTECENFQGGAGGAGGGGGGGGANSFGFGFLPGGGGGAAGSGPTADLAAAGERAWSRRFWRGRWWGWSRRFWRRRWLGE